MAAATFSPCNFITDRDPQKFGGQQFDYVEKSEAAILKVVADIRTGIKTQRPLTQVFQEALNFFATTRHELAVQHGTTSAHDFGQRRIDSLNDVPYTVMTKEYQSFNEKILTYLSQILSGSIPIKGNLTQKKFFAETTCLGRKCSFEATLYETKDIHEHEWDNQFPSFMPQSLATLSPVPGADSVREDSFSRTEEEKTIVIKVKEELKKIKAHAPLFYIHGKIEYMLRAITSAFPPPKELMDPSTGAIHLCGNPFFLKSIYVLGKVRIEIDKKMYALSEYLTWTYQDHTTDPVERMKHSTVVIIHQDEFLIEPTVKEISSIFEKAILWNKEKDSIETLKKEVALIRYLFAHSMPYSRGSAAIGEWIEKSVYSYHNFSCEHKSTTMGDLEAFAAPLFSSFLEKYDATVTITDRVS
jgi:hypothetical protein